MNTAEAKILAEEKFEKEYGKQWRGTPPSTVDLMCAAFEILQADEKHNDMDGQLLIKDLWYGLKEPKYYKVWVNSQESKCLDNPDCEEYHYGKCNLIWKGFGKVDEFKFGVRFVLGGIWVTFWDDSHEKMVTVQKTSIFGKDFFYEITTRQDLKDCVRMYNQRIEKPNEKDIPVHAKLSKYNEVFQDYESKLIKLELTEDYKQKLS